MNFGIGHLSIVPLRFEPSDQSEMVSQLLYGELFIVLEKQEKWSKVKLFYDAYEAWIDNKQFLTISEDEYHNYAQKARHFSSDLVDFINTEKKQLLPIFLGSSLHTQNILQHTFEGNFVKGKLPKNNLIETALLYLNAPYLWGGKTPFGIDCSGFTQMVYQINGFQLLRDASQQATQGEVLSFIEEAEAGDLAFFDNEEGTITHVGIIMQDNHIIHASGKVRIDILDQSGIFNTDLKKHTHQLRVIKRIV
ncbi:MAG: C40 family peptidase [Flavobacteriales bacterium]